MSRCYQNFSNWIPTGICWGVGILENFIVIPTFGSLQSQPNDANSNNFRQDPFQSFGVGISQVGLINGERR